jgi:hypothetical protein
MNGEKDGRHAGDRAIGRFTDRTEPTERRISARQLYAIQLLLEGRTEAEVARLVEVRLAQLRAWRQQPRFRRAFATAESGESWKLMTAMLLERQIRRRPKPETPWTSETEEETDE